MQCSYQNGESKNNTDELRHCFGIVGQLWQTTCSHETKQARTLFTMGPIDDMYLEKRDDRGSLCGYLASCSVFCSYTMMIGAAHLFLWKLVHGQSGT